MVQIERLRVSLTKNGYLKIADIVKRYPRWEVLDNVEGLHPGINVKRSQAAAILDADKNTGQIPAYWDEIKEFGSEAVESFTFLAIVLSHSNLIEVFRDSSRGGMYGHLRRDSLRQEKVYTNVVYAMASLGLCEYERGATATDFDFYLLVSDLRDAGHLVRRLIKSKLQRCGWIDPEYSQYSKDDNFETVCRTLGLPEVFGLEPEQFEAWLDNVLEMEDADVERIQRSSRFRRLPR